MKSKAGVSGLVTILLLFFATSYAQNLRISGGNNYSLIICGNGNVAAWGNGANGQTGKDNGGADNGTVSTPTRVFNLPEIFQVDAGSGGHALALTCDNQIVAWGNNAECQLGNSAAPVSSSDPFFVENVGGGGTISGIKFVSGGNDASYAITADDRVVSWGSNADLNGVAEGSNNGVLGTGSTSTTLSACSPAYVQKLADFRGPAGDLTDVVLVEAGDANGYALTSDGYVYSWGDTQNEANARTGNNTRAGLVVDVNGDPIADITSISAGDRHTLALASDGTVWAWGGDWGEGQIGDRDDAAAAGGYWYLNYATKVATGMQGSASGDLENIVAIAAGQSHSMAVTATGELYTWGGSIAAANGSGSDKFSMLGRGCNPAGYGGDNGTNTKPVLAQTGPGVALTGITDVSDGDFWTFAIDDNNDIWVAGYGPNGELGTGNTEECYFTQLSIPNCNLSVPCPNPDLTDVEVCSGDDYTFNAGQIYPGFTATWTLPDASTVIQANPYGTDGSGSPIDVQLPVTNISAADLGNYNLTIVDNRTDTQRPCVECTDIDITVELDFIAAPFTDPGNLEFCGSSITANVNGTSTGQYEWYPTLTSTSLLGTSSGIAGDVTFNTSNVIEITGSAPTRVATVYVEDVSSFNATHNYSLPSGTPGNNGIDDMNLTVTNTFSLNSVDARVEGYSATNPIEVEFTVTRPGGGTTIHIGSTPGENCGGLCPGLRTLVFTPAIDFDVVGNYTFEVSGGNNVRSFSNGFTYPSNFVNGSVPIFSITGKNQRPDLASGVLALTNFDITAGTVYPCGRLPVVITENCPPCNKPASVDAGSAVNQCEETSLDLSGSYEDGGNAVVNGSMNYVWYQTGSPAPGDYTTISGTGTVNVGDQSFASLVPANAGTWTLRVEDGNTGDATCYTEATVEVTVSTVPELSITDPDAVCSPNTVDITASAVTAGSTNPGDLSYWTNAGATASYATPASATDGTYYIRMENPGNTDCFDIETVEVTVDITPDLSISDPAAVCAPNTVDITDAAIRTGSTDLGPLSYFTDAGATSTYATPTTAADGTYYIRSENATNASCVDIEPVTVTVNPTPAVTAMAATVCSGDAFTVTPADGTDGTVPTGTTYTWVAPAGTGFAGGAAGTAQSNISGTLTNTGTTPATATYSVTPTVGGCPGNSFNVVVTINPAIDISAQPQDVSTCAGSDVSFGITATGTSLTYQWQKDGSDLSGETGTTLSLTNVQVSDQGDYTVIVSSACGGPVTSDIAELNITATEIPSVSIASINPICSGGDAIITITAANGGGAAPTFTYFRDGTAIAGATNLADTPANRSFTVTGITVNTDVYVELTSNSTCLATGATNPAPSNTETIAVVAPPTLTLVTPATATPAYQVGTASTGLEVSSTTTGTGYTTSWVINSGQGALSTPSQLTTDLTGLIATDPDPGSTTNITVRVADDGNLCTPATETFDVVRVDQTIPNLDDPTICEGGTAQIALPDLISGLESERIVSVSGGASAMIVGRNIEMNTTGLAAGTYDITYEIDNSISGISTDVATVTVVAQPVITLVTPAAATPAYQTGSTAEALEISSTTAGTGYTISWVINSGQGALSTTDQLTTNLTGLNDTDPTPGSTTNITVSITDDGSLCNKAMETFDVVRVDQTIPNLSDPTVCAGSTAQIALPAMLIAGIETERIVSVSGGAIANIVGRNIEMNTTGLAVGTYDITYEIDNSINGIETDIATVTVIDVPENDGDFTIADRCEGATMIFTATGATNADPLLYTWGSTNAADNGSSGLNGTFTVGGATPTYEITLTPENSCGTGTPIIKTANVNFVPSGGTLSPDVTSVCSGDNPALVTFTLSGVTGANTPNPDNNWILGSQSASSGGSTTDNTVSFDMSGTTGLGNYSVSVTPSNACGPGSELTSSVSVIDPLVPTVSLSLNIFCEDTEGLTATASPSVPITGVQYNFYNGGTQVAGPQLGNTHNFAQGDIKDGDQVRVELDMSGATGGCYITPGPGVAVPDASATADGYKIPVLNITSTRTAVCEEETNGIEDFIDISLSVTPETSKGLTRLELLQDGSSEGLTTDNTLPKRLTLPSQSGEYTGEAENPHCPVGEIAAGSGESVIIYEEPEVSFVLSALTGREGVDSLTTVTESKQIIQSSIDKEEDYVLDLTALVTLDPSVNNNLKYAWTVVGTEDLISLDPTASLGIDQELDDSLQITVTNELCEDTETYSLFFFYPLSVPNAFSPNGDGINDQWFIQGLTDFPNAEVLIYNRWGNKVYEEVYSPEKAWDGEGYAVGTYYYIIKLNKSRWEKALTGALTLTR